MIPKKPNILVVTPYPLLPANSGGRLYALSTIEPLSKEYRFHLLAMANREERAEFDQDRSQLLDQYHSVFQSVQFVDKPPLPYELGSKLKKLAHIALHAVFEMPLMDSSYFAPKAISIASSIVRKQRIDLLEVHHLHVAFYRRFFPKLPAVLVNHNIESELWPFWEKKTGSPLGMEVWNFFGKISRKNSLEIEINNKYRFDAKFYISELDMAKVSPDGCRLCYLPMSVRPEYTVKKFHQRKFTVLWVGGFFWEPNRDAILWFLEEIWPLIKARSMVPLELHVVGSNPPEELARQNDGKEVFVHGYVPDVRRFFEAADAFVVPIRHGGGTRIKIIDALNAGIPVVTTSKGCEGLPVARGQNILVADDPTSFAIAIGQLTGFSELRERLSRNGREYCRAHHHPEAIAKAKSEVYQQVLGAHHQ